MPPWIDTISGLFSATVMRKPNTSASGAKSSTVNTKASNPLNRKSVLKNTMRTNAKSGNYVSAAATQGPVGSTAYRSEATQG